MTEQTERRSEKRLRYHWPIWFAEDFNQMLSQGQMVDVCSGGAAFTCRKDQYSPYPGQNLTARFSVPKFSENNSFDMAGFTRSGWICRVEDVNDHIRRIAMQFAEPLPFLPGEQADEDAELTLDTVTI